MLFNRGLVILADRELMILTNIWVIELNMKGAIVWVIELNITGAIVLSNTELIILAKREVTLQYESEKRRIRTEQMAASTYKSSR